MMSLHICDFWWPEDLYHKDTDSIEFSSIYHLWDMRYMHLSDFSHFQKCDNHVITP